MHHITISGNTARGSESDGGGTCGGVVAISNSGTVSGNFAYDKGGAFYNGGGTWLVRNCTLNGNSATLGTDGISNTGANAVLEIGNTILSNQRRQYRQ